MNPKRKNVQIHKLFCISNLMLENLDELKPTTPRMVKLKADLIDFCEELKTALQTRQRFRNRLILVKFHIR